MRAVLLGFFLALGVTVVMPAGARASDDDPPTVTIALTIDPASGRVAARSRVDPAGASVIVRPGADWLGIDRLSYDGREQSHPADGMGMRLQAGKTGTVEMAATGRLPDISHRFGAAGVSPEGGYILGQAGWVPEVEAAATYRLTLEIAGPWRAAITGRVLSDEIDDDGVQRITALFENALEPPSVFFGPYDVASRVVGDLTVRTYFPAALSELSGTYLDAAAGFIGRYDAEIGAYPYGQFSIVAAPIPVGLGFAGLTYVGSQILPHPYMQGRSLAHEVLHSWLGNAVAVDYENGNWAEGLTAYLADHALAQDAGAGVALRGDWLTEIANLPEDRRRPIRAFRAAAHGQSQAIGYGKTAMMFHMLRAQLGEADFNAGLRAFWSEQQFALAGWPEVQDAFEGAARVSLDAFFSQWLDRADLPALRLSAAQRAGNAVTLTLVQDQAGAAYALKVPVRVQLQDGTVEERFVTMAERETTLALEFDATPEAVFVDPGFDLARTLWPGERATVLSEVFAARSVAIEVATPAYAEAAETWRARALRRPAGDGGARVVIGTRDDVLAARATAFPMPPAAQVAESVSAAWVEADSDGRDWLFLAAPRPDVLAQDFARLRYYGNRSYVLPGEGDLETGVWAVRDSPMSKRFD